MDGLPSVYTCASSSFSFSSLIGWSDQAIFAIFENGHYAADQDIFMSPIPIDRQIWERARFHFQKVAETKMNTFFRKF